MCELLALSSSRPARLTFSLQTLASRGGATGSAHDGWGVAFYQGQDVALFREPAAAADSALVRFLQSQGPATDLAISHIRHATQGTVSLANTQPFARELGGRTHVFAHNGDLPGIYRCDAFALGAARPVGQTDSEHAFCALLDRLGVLWKTGHPPSVEARLTLMAAFAADLRTLGPANFLYADGDALFSHGHRRMQRSSHRAEPPGLWIRQRHCAAAETPPDQSGGVSIAQAEQAVVWIASVPLTEDDWRPLAEGEVLAVRDGEVLGSRLPAVALAGAR
jgi:predicted glutamine amidotransferase